MRKKNSEISSEYRILIVDDDVSIVESLSFMLKRSGYAYEGISNPVKAIEKLRTEHFDLLILDFLMDGIHGDKVVEKVREFNKEIYILLLTGYKDLAPPMETLKSLEIQGYCEKSDKFDQLMLMVESGIKSVSQLRTISNAHKEIEKLYSLLEENYQDEIDRNEVLEQVVLSRTASIRNLLNNAGQGFLTFGEDLLIDKEFSVECARLFDEEIEGKNICKLIFHQEGEQIDFFESIFGMILKEKKEYKKEVYFSLLPKEIVLHGRNIHLNFKIISNTADESIREYMLIMTDITEKRVLENRMETERNILKMVVKVVVNFNYFMGILKDFREFTQFGIHKMINSGMPLKEMVFEIYRNVHTYKGCFSQMGVIQAVKCLHEFESEIYEMQENLARWSYEDLKHFFIDHDMSTWLDKDLETLRDILGEDFLNRASSLIIDKEKLIEIEKKMLLMLPPEEYKILLPAIRKLRFKPFNELLKTYPEYTEQLAQKLQKKINPFRVLGDEIFVDDERYQNFAKNLIHIFRNIVDHGLETSTERLASGKEELGNVRCCIMLIENKISIVIADDGRGIDLEKLREKVIERGIFNEEQAREANDEKILNLIFEDGFSTKEEVNELSGRGLGLSAVKNEVTKIGGEIKVQTQRGMGTEFDILIPLDDIEDFSAIAEVEF